MRIDNKAPLALPRVAFVECNCPAGFEEGLRGEEVDVRPAGTIARLEGVIDDFPSSDEEVVSGAGRKIGIEMKIWARDRSRLWAEG